MANKKFEPHMMYDAKKAETHKEHLELKRKGYGHDKSSFKMRTPFRCWTKAGYIRTPGTVKGEKGSCYKPGKK